MAFQILIDCLPVIKRYINEGEKLTHVKELLENSLEAYRKGDKVTEGCLLNDIHDIVAPNRYGTYAKRKDIEP